MRLLQHSLLLFFFVAACSSPPTDTPCASDAARDASSGDEEASFEDASAIDATDAADGGTDAPASCAPIVSSGTTSLNYQIDSAHDGAQLGDQLSLPLCQRWEVTLPNRASYPVVEGHRVFVEASTQGSLQSIYAFDESTGSPLWGPVDIGGSFAGIAADAGHVYGIGLNGLLSALDPTTGQLLWATQLSPAYIFQFAPMTAGGRVYINGLGMNEWLYALDGTSGDVLWSSSPSGEGSPSLGDGLLESGEALSAFDLAGSIVWQQSTSGGAGTAPLFEDRLYDHDVVRDAKTGATLTSFTSDRTPAFGGKLGVYIEGGSVVGIDPSSWTIRWTYSASAALAPLLVGAAVVVATGGGDLLALDGQTGTLMSSANVGASILPTTLDIQFDRVGMAAADGRLFVPAGNTLVSY